MARRLVQVHAGSWKTRHSNPHYGQTGVGSVRAISPSCCTRRLGGDNQQKAVARDNQRLESTFLDHFGRFYSSHTVSFRNIFLFSLSFSRYQKYLYDYECSRENLSSPADLQSAIEGNKREGRRNPPTSNGSTPMHHHHSNGAFSYPLLPNSAAAAMSSLFSRHMNPFAMRGLFIC